MTLLIYGIIAVISTVLGGALTLYLGRRASQTQLSRILAFGSGAMVGVVFLHLLPEAAKGSAMLAGVGAVVVFLAILGIEGFTMVHPCAEVIEECSVHSFGMLAGAVFFLHSWGDGLAIAGAFSSSASLGHVVSLAVVWHKFIDGLMLSSLLINSTHGSKASGIMLIIITLGMFTPLGIFSGMFLFKGISMGIMALFLGAVAGGFLYIGAADVLPRLHRAKDKACWALFCIGVVIIGLIR